MTSPTRTARLPEKMSADREQLDALLASTVLAHVAYVEADGRPGVVPTAAVRWEDRLVVHGSTGSRWMRLLASGVPVCVSMAAIDGMVVARSAFESSLVYRSAVIRGRLGPLEAQEKEAALDTVTERLIPGRTSEVRRSTRRELAATLLLAMPLDDWSLRISDGMPEDPPDDVAGPAWGGQVRFAAPYAEVVAAPDLSPGIDPPRSLGGITGVR